MHPAPMDIVVNEELKAYIEPLTPEEHDALERSILAEGCRDALVLWGNVLVDGHNRYGICQKHGKLFLHRWWTVCPFFFLDLNLQFQVFEDRVDLLYVGLVAMKNLLNGLNVDFGHKQILLSL